MLHLALKFATSHLQSAHTLVVSQSLYIYIHVLVACPSREKYLQKSLPRIWTLDSETCMHFLTFFSPLLLQWVLSVTQHVLHSTSLLSNMLWQMLSSFHLYRWAKGEDFYTSKYNLLFWKASKVSFNFSDG